MASNPSWRQGKTTAERGYGGHWQRARETFLGRHPLCCYCDRRGRVTAATIVDHIKPHQGDQALFWDTNNWQPLCKDCHDTVKAQEEGRHTKRPRIGLDGYPVEAATTPGGGSKV